MITVFIILTIIFFLAVSAFFSASETAITAASRPKLHNLSKKGDRRAPIILDLQKKIGLVISALLVGNTIFNTWAVSLANGLLITFFGAEGVLYASILMSILIILFAEVSPKMIAVYHPERLLLRTVSLLKLIFLVFRPLTLAINFLVRKMLLGLGLKAMKHASSVSSKEELHGIIDLHRGKNPDIAHERAMLKSILDLRSVTVSDIMIHRKNVTMLDIEKDVDALIDQAITSPFTRLPLYKKNPDNIVGVVHVKALLKELRSHKGQAVQLDLLKISHKPWFVPESTDLLDQLQAFRQGEHMAIVVDEYGAFMGIVTLEDILEEIVGEISDEHDIVVKGVRPEAEGSFIVDGAVTLRDLNREYDWDLPDEEASTLAGLILFKARSIPEVGQIFRVKKFRLEVLRRQRQQITLIRLTPLIK